MASTNRELLLQLSKRANTRTSDKMPLTMDDEDVSEDGKFYIQFADPGGVAYDNFFTAVRQEQVTRETGNGESFKEVAMLSYRLWPGIVCLVEDKVIMDAAFPILQDGGDIQARKWKDDVEEDLEWLRTAPRSLHEFIINAAMEFLNAPSELEEDLGNSPKPTDEPSEPTEK